MWPFAQSAGKLGTIETLYAEIVARARRPEEFERFGIADTADNRREWLGCWCSLVMIRLHRTDDQGAQLAQALFDHAFADLEDNFREQGVADMSIGKHVKKAAATFLARYRDIERAIDTDDPQPLAASLAKNMQIVQGGGADGMARLLMGSFVDLASMPDKSVLKEQLFWRAQS